MNRDENFPEKNNLTGTGQDITHRKKTEDSLRKSEKMYRSTIDHLGEGVHVIDRDMKIILCNSLFLEWMRKYELGGEIIGRKVVDVFPFLSEKVLEEYNRVFRTGETLVTKETHIIHQSPVTSETRKIPIFEDDQVINIVTVIRDITREAKAERERKNLEAQIQHAQKLESLGVLAGGIAHDFNNLLMGIIGNADLCLAELSATSPLRYHLNEVQNSASRAAELCKQMLAYSGKGQFVMQSTDLNKVIEEISHLLEIFVSEKAIIKYNLAENPPSVKADPSQIRQVIMNLVTNASEAIGDRSGIISITTGVMECDREYFTETFVDEDLPEGQYVYLEISDTGTGMDAETKTKIFDPFFSTKFTGRGLGLAAVLGIVRGHRGSVKVYSENNRGSTFKIILPAESKKKVMKRKEQSRKYCGSGVILIIDDEKTVRNVTRLMLERAGFKVLEASDGKEGVEIFRENKNDIRAVLLDLTMPVMDGEETFRKLREIQETVPVILSSGYREQNATERFSGKGLAGFIQKPYRASDLIDKIREILEGHS